MDVVLVYFLRLLSTFFSCLYSLRHFEVDPNRTMEPVR